MINKCKKYINTLGWTYQVSNNVVCIFGKDNHLIKTISLLELATLIKTRMVKEI